MRHPIKKRADVTGVGSACTFTLIHIPSCAHIARVESEDPTHLVIMSMSAEDMLRAADKKATSSGGWFSSSQGKLEEAAELYKGAGNKFRIDNRFEEAGHAFMKAAETEIKNNEPDFAANTFFEASKSFKMARPERECTHTWGVSGSTLI